VEDLIKPVVKLDKILVLPIHLRNQDWAGLIMKKYDDDLQVIYNDPRRNSYLKEVHVKSLICTIRDLESIEVISDLKVEQQSKDNADSVVLTIENMITLATANTEGLNRVKLQKLLPSLLENNLGDVKTKHLIIEDSSLWYSDSKIKKILEIELKGKQVHIAPITVLHQEGMPVAMIEEQYNSNIDKV